MSFRLELMDLTDTSYTHPTQHCQILRYLRKIFACYKYFIAATLRHRSRLKLVSKALAIRWRAVQRARPRPRTSLHLYLSNSFCTKLLVILSRVHLSSTLQNQSISHVHETLHQMPNEKFSYTRHPLDYR